MSDKPLNPLQMLLKNSQKPSAPAPSQPKATADATRTVPNGPQTSGAVRVNPLLALTKAVPSPTESQQQPSVEPAKPAGLSILGKFGVKSQVPAANIAAQQMKQVKPESKALQTVAAIPAANKVEEVDESAPLSLADRLNELDRLILKDNGISIFTLDAIRSHVKQVMIQLKEEPELDAILIDRDVHNILAFIRHVRVDAMAAQTTKVEKVAAKAKKGGVGRLKFDMAGALAGLDELAGKKI